jgi:hypothetical protein
MNKNQATKIIKYYDCIVYDMMVYDILSIYIHPKLAFDRQKKKR